MFLYNIDRAPQISLTTNKDVWLAARLIPKACDYRRDRIKTPNLLSGFSHLPLLPLVPTQPGLRPIACRSAFCLKYRRDYYCLGGRMLESKWICVCTGSTWRTQQVPSWEKTSGFSSITISLSYSPHAFSFFPPS